MKQLVILSGKGGTGKTSVTAAFAHLAYEKGVQTVLADGDVDAANLELVLQPRRLEGHTFMGGAVAEIDGELCQGCGICEEVCRFEAISLNPPTGPHRPTGPHPTTGPHPPTRPHPPTPSPDSGRLLKK